jgi:hypothetical protein
MKALVGALDNRPYRLLAELTALRTRVAQLEHELALAREEADLLRDAVASAAERDVEIALTH